ncbi:MAG TPA: TIGR03435 family protein [Bryobacteraceae bacterium]|nr:TIGR03435 family protein [Bryobacteraceae bacterium]
MRATVLTIALLASSAAWAQPAGKVEFEVVSIKPSPPPVGGGFMVSCSGGPETKDPTLFTCQNMSLTNLISRAYEMPYYRVTAADWMEQTRFHLNARVPAGATKAQLDLMLQDMLVTRFKLAVHHESKELAQFDLVVAKNGPKFKPAEEPPAPKEDGASSPPAPKQSPLHMDKEGYPVLEAGIPGMAIMNGRARVYQPAGTMERLAALLSAQLRRPVNDATGLTGKYEISLYWDADTMRSPSQPLEPGPNLIQAVQDQLGLRLESKKGPVDFLIVDHAEKVPTEN